MYMFHFYDGLYNCSLIHNYSRPFSIEEANEFLYLYSLGFYHNQDIKCKDNIISINNAFVLFL